MQYVVEVFSGSDVESLVWWPTSTLSWPAPWPRQQHQWLALRRWNCDKHCSVLYSYFLSMLLFLFHANTYFPCEVFLFPSKGIFFCDNYLHYIMIRILQLHYMTSNIIHDIPFIYHTLAISHLKTLMWHVLLIFSTKKLLITTSKTDKRVILHVE